VLKDTNDFAKRFLVLAIIDPGLFVARQNKNLYRYPLLAATDFNRTLPLAVFCKTGDENNAIVPAWHCQNIHINPK